MDDTLFVSVEDIQKYVAVSLTSSENVITPYLKQATSKYLVPVLGPDAISLFMEIVHGSTPGVTEERLKAISLTKLAVANFAYFLAASILNVHIGDAGIMVASTSNLAPASKHRTDELKADLLSAGWDAVNELLKHLDTYRDELQDLFSPELTAMYSLFVSNANDYNRYVNIDSSFLRFYNLRQAIERAEFLHLMPVMSQELYGELKAQVRQGEVSEANQQLLLPIKAFLCYKSAQEEIDPRYATYADHALAYLKRYLDDHLEDYPLYANSSVYDGDKTSYSIFENDDEHGFLFFSNPNMKYLVEILISAIVFTVVANAGVLVAFYFNTKYQLRRHDKDIECLMEELKHKADTVSLDDLKRDLNQKFACIDSKLNNIYDHLINHKT